VVPGQRSVEFFRQLAHIPYQRVDHCLRILAPNL
jgi:hypothetical protein